MAPVHAKVAMGRHNTAVFVIGSRSHGKRQRIGVVIRIQGNVHALRRIFCLNLVIGEEHAGGIVHVVIGDPQPHCILASGKIAGHVHDAAGVLCRTAHGISLDPGVFCRTIPVACNGHDIILIQDIKRQGTRAAEIFRAHADAHAHGYHVGMHVGFAFHRICRQILIVGYVRTECIGYFANRDSRSARMGLAARNLYGHVHDLAARFASQLFLRIGAQVLFSGRIHLARFQIGFIRIITLSGNILICYGHFAGRVYFFCPADVAVICIIQVGIGQGPAAGKALFRSRESQRNRSVDLGQGILACHFHILNARVSTALDTALDIVPDFAHRRRDTGSDRFAVGSGIGVGNVYTAGHLNIGIIGAVQDTGPAAVAVCRFVPDHQGVYIAVALVQGKPEGHAAVYAGSLLVVGYRHAQGRGRLRPAFQGLVFNGPGVDDFHIVDDSFHVPFQVVHAQRRAQRSFVGVIVGSRTRSAGKPVHGSRPGPGAVEYIVAARIQQLARLSTGPQIQFGIVNHGSRSAIHLIPADTACHCRIKSSIRRIGVGCLDHIHIAYCPGFFNTHVRLVKYLIQCGKRSSHNVLHGTGALVMDG